jgi:hypothetical protein
VWHYGLFEFHKDADYEVHKIEPVGSSFTFISEYGESGYS